MTWTLEAMVEFITWNMIQQKLTTSAQKLNYTFQIGLQLYSKLLIEYLLIYGDKYIGIDLFLSI